LQGFLFCARIYHKNKKARIKYRLLKLVQFRN